MFSNYQNRPQEKERPREQERFRQQERPREQAERMPQNYNVHAQQYQPVVDQRFSLQDMKMKRISQLVQEKFRTMRDCKQSNIGQTQEIDGKQIDYDIVIDLVGRGCVAIAKVTDNFSGKKTVSKYRYQSQKVMRLDELREQKKGFFGNW